MRHELNNWSESKKRLYGKGYEDAVEHIERQLHEQFAQLIKDASYIVCDKVKASFRHEEPKPDQIASSLFHHAYPYRPPAGSSVMLTSSNNGQRYTAAIGRYLITNGLSKETFQNLEKAQQNLVTDVLVEGTDKWGVLDKNYRLKGEPSHSKVQKAWQTLNKAIPTEERLIHFDRLIQQFKGMPYGYDDLALTFLFTAWIGVHQHELSFMGALEPKGKQVQPRPLTIAAVQGQLTTARKFIQWLEDGKVAVLRTDIGRWKQAAADCIERMRVVNDYKTALELLGESEKYKEKLPEEDEQLQALIKLEEELREDIAEVLEEQFQHWRQEQEKMQREARNQQRVSDAVKRAKLAWRWIEIPEALSAIGQTKNELESPSNELLARLEQAEAQLLQRRAELQEWVKKLPELIKQSTTLPAIDSLRGELNNREGDYAGDEQLESILSDARSTLSQRRDFLRELDRFEKQADSVENCLTALEQIEQLQPIPDGLYDIVNVFYNRLKALHAKFEEERRRTIEAWLKQFADALDGELDIEQAKQLQQILQNERPLGLTEKDNATIARVQAAIWATFDKHQLEKVIMEFEQLTSAELKSECLSRMIMLSREQLSENAIEQLYAALKGKYDK